MTIVCFSILGTASFWMNLDHQTVVISFLVNVKNPSQLLLYPWSTNAGLGSTPGMLNKHWKEKAEGRLEWLWVLWNSHTPTTLGFTFSDLVQPWPNSFSQCRSTRVTGCGHGDWLECATFGSSWKASERHKPSGLSEQCKSLSHAEPNGPNTVDINKLKQDEAHEPECRHVCWQTETILICNIFSKLTCETPWVHTLRWHYCLTLLPDTLVRHSYLTLL